MDDNLLWKVIVGLMGALMTLIGINLKMHKADHEKLKDSHYKLKDDHSENKLYMSNEYARKTDLNAARLESSDSIRRLHEKIEDVNENLGKKMADLPEKIVNLITHRK